MGARDCRGLLAALAALALSAAGCSQAAVNKRPLAEVLRLRLEPQEVTPKTSLAQMCRLYQTSPGLVRRLNAGNPVLGPADELTEAGVLYMPRVTCDAVLNTRRRTLAVYCGTTMVRIYPCRFGPKAAGLRSSSFLVRNKMKRKEGAEEAAHLGTRALNMGSGFVIHGGAPEVEPNAIRYMDAEVRGAGACVQISNSNMEELYDLLEKGATIMLVYE